VVKQDDAQVIIATSSGSEVVSASDVESMTYDGLRFSPSTPSRQTVSPSQEEVAIDPELLGRVRTRLLAVHRYLKQMQRVLTHLAQGNTDAAGLESQRAAQWLLPTSARGALSPFSALADLVILLWLRAPLLWLVLVLLRERRTLIRILEFLILGYCLVMLLMVVIGLACGQSLPLGIFVELVGIPVLAIVLTFLFLWVFALRVRKGLVALALAVVLNVGIEHLLLASSR